LLQQFVADRLLELPPAPAVDPETIDRFLARVPHHKVAVLAFSTATKASIPLRHAAEQHKHNVVAGRVQWKAEVLSSCLLAVFKRAWQALAVLYRWRTVFWHICVMLMPNLLVINTNMPKNHVPCAQNSKGLTSRSDVNVLNGATAYDDTNK
jgi:hypothetical protein